jgi:perosamine synthetase
MQAKPNPGSYESVRIAKPYNSEEIERQVITILRSGRLVQGEITKEFESEIAKYIGCKYVVAVNSGTAALHCAISALKSIKGNKKEVITTPLSFSATANSVFHAGCKPVFVDVVEETFNIDPTLVKEKLGADTLAVEPVDVYGLPAQLDTLQKIAGSKGATVVEDAAEAIGAKYHGSKIGNISTLSCFSTYATKNLHTGEGGFVTTNDDLLADRMRLIRNQGQKSKYNQVLMGYNFRMLEISAAIGLYQIPMLDEMNAKRRANAMFLKERLSSLDCLSFQQVDDPKSHSWYMFSLLLDSKRAKKSRDVVVQKLKERGIEADISWPTPIHLQPYYREAFGYKKGDFPIAERICEKVFQLPIQPFLTETELEKVVRETKDILQD